ncbi:uncharacterized protein TRUGW13939_08245 [Talaromyces rugulosus]|uniref:Uncharacterized protein n=1 Tax=Talaromyces rugulosus TaxID=121627 RepID=A0A7H8R3Z7_TALRU|nr:uncharacterized protein TRUGW13939_08245 [Talaromyces rugulosus]QKX61099.1 hypothetical protein TRUGW13939_08245 [Talaromyces rugulosus]
MKPSAPSFCEPQQHKEVRFEQPLVRVRRARSVASSNPLLDPVHRSSRAAKKSSDEYGAYLEQSRSILENQRLNFERERLVFAQERKLWEIERTMLKSRIVELESAGSGAFQTSFRNPDFGLKGDSMSHTQQHPVWEGPIPGSRRPTRVFPEETGKPDLYIPPTEANGFGFRSSLDAALSPLLFRPADETSVPVPIEKVDSQLDGITLKSTALPPDVVAKVMTPPTSISPTSSPPKTETESSKQAADGKSPLRLELSSLGPPAENLTRNAGHTPMAILGTETEISTRTPSEMGDDEVTLAPVVTKQPIENSESYFPPPDDDPALTGPLSLRNEAESDNSFFSLLDKKLLDEAKKAVSGPSDADADDADESKGGEEPDPELKLKASTNFGTVFGQVE